MGSNEPVFGEAVGLTGADHDVVEYADVEKLQSVDQAARDRAIGLAWICNARRVVVGENDSGGVATKCFFRGKRSTNPILPDSA